MLRFITAYILLVALFNCRETYALDFEDCGGDPLYSVTIDGCTESPCAILRGANYHFYITPEYVDPVVNNIRVEGGITQYGAFFGQHTVIDDPGYPISRMLDKPQLSINITLSFDLVQVPGLLQINATYLSGSSERTGFCITTMVDVF